MNFEKPLPTPTPTSAPFWDGLRDGVVRLQRCDSCRAWIHYPRNRCPKCLSDALSWHDVAGTGSLYTFTIARQPTAPHFADEVADSDIRVGMPVRPYFDPVTDEITLLRYQPA